MTRHLTVDALFARHVKRLQLKWICSQEAGARILEADDSTPWPANLVGHMNLVRPHQVQVLGRSESEYLDGLVEAEAKRVCSALMESRPACIILAGKHVASKALVSTARAAGIALLSSPVGSDTVVQALQHDLARRFARRHTVHGVFIEVMGVGVLITGDAGIGKSELALELISRGHRLVADDTPEFYLTAPGILEGACPPALQDFMEVRGLGVVNVRELFGDGSVKRDRNLGLIIRLEVFGKAGLLPNERLEGIRRMREILDVAVPEYTLPVAPGRNLSVLVECTVRTHLLLNKGYNAAKRLSDRQRREMDNDGDGKN